jgi:histidine triad (HIT) family protein
MGRLMVVARRLAEEAGASDGFRAIVNTGRVGRQEVMHLHMHVVGGKDVLPPMIARV